MNISKWLRTFFTQSPRLHLRRRVESVADAIGVIDRFVDGQSNYPLEWDDFVSWAHSNASVEKVRQEVNPLEIMTLSSNREERAAADARLIEIRNFHARFHGIPQRQYPPGAQGAPRIDE